MLAHSPNQAMDYRVPLGPQSQSTGTYDGSEFYSLAQYNSVQFICSAQLGNGETAVFKLLEATNTGGTSATVVTARTFTLTGARSGQQMFGILEGGPYDLTDCQTKHFVGVRCILTGTGAVIGASANLLNARQMGIPHIDPTTDELYASDAITKDDVSETNDGV